MANEPNKKKPTKNSAKASGSEAKDGMGPSKWGYSKTDPATHWKKGCPSPNPTGRPKGSKNQKTIWNEANAIKVEVNIDGKPQKMPKKEVKYYQLSDKAAKGDLKAIAMSNELDAKFDPVETVPPTPEESTADYDTLEIWVGLLETFKVFKETEGDEDGTNNDDAGGGNG